ncbi:MAG: iron chaperone [Limisphaerales bacterium]
MAKARPSTVTQYKNAAPKEARSKLRELRAILKKAAPEAKERLKWGAPVFEEKRILFAYSAFKSHLNFFPTHSALAPFKKELAGSLPARIRFNSPMTNRSRMGLFAR